MPAHPAKRKRQPEWGPKQVKALRAHMGLTQAQFAEELGTLQQTVSEWECGYHTPKGTSVKLLHLVAQRAGFAYGTKSAEGETLASAKP
jgi:DNA-binding transcriptional regulator YiaG